MNFKKIADTSFKIINNSLSVFWGYVSFFWYFYWFYTVCEVVSGLLYNAVLLLPIKSVIAFAVFWITLFEVIVSIIVADCFAWSKVFWLCLPLQFLLIFLPMF